MKTGNAVMVIGLLAFAALGYGLYTGAIKLPQQGSVAPTPGGTCYQNPSLVTVASDALSGAAVTSTGLYLVNGAQTSTSPTTQGPVSMVYRAAGYINATASTTLGCGSNALSVQMYKYAAPTITIYDNAGTAVLTSGATGGANNETIAAAGGSYNWKFHVVGTSLYSTGNMIVVVDFTAPAANVSQVSMSGATPVAVPRGYSSQTSGGAQYAFAIPAAVGNSQADYNIQVQAAANKIIQGSVYTRAYSLSPFFDTNNQIVTNAAYDSLGTAEYVGAPTDYNFCINAKVGMAC